MNLFLIDLDNTLYPKELGVFDAIDKKINEYMRIELNMNDKEINETRLKYWNKYGTTMSGLIKHYGIDPYHFLKFVHDVDIKSLIKPNPRLLNKLKSINAVKIVFTNAPKEHAINVLEALNIENQFVDIFDIISADFIGKPNIYAYEKIMKITKANQYIMADDWEINLQTAKQVGISTILVGNKTSNIADLCVDRFEDISIDLLKASSNAPA